MNIDEALNILGNKTFDRKLSDTALEIYDGDKRKTRVRISKIVTIHPQSVTVETQPIRIVMLQKGLYTGKLVDCKCKGFTDLTTMFKVGIAKRAKYGDTIKFNLPNEIAAALG